MHAVTALLAVAALVLSAAAVLETSGALRGSARWLPTRAMGRDDLADAVRALAAELAAGRTLDRALARVGSSLTGPAGTAFARSAPRVARGEPIGSSLSRELAQGRRTSYACAALELHARTGGDLVRLLRGMATTLDERRRVDAEIRALTAQARFSSLIVPALPLVGLLLLVAVDPESATRLFTTGAGIAIVTASLVLDLIGAWLIRRISRGIA